MRELVLSEISLIGGASANDGYTFTFAVSNALTVGILGSIFIGGDFFKWAAIGGGYGLLMMATRVMDNYYFPPEDSTVLITKITPIESTASSLNHA